MKRIVLVPIEPIPERYSEQWLRWWPEELQRLGHEVGLAVGPRLLQEQGIQTGQFLDVFDTHFYKAGQLQELARMFQNGEMDDWDVILFLDAWNPAILQVAYMRDAVGSKVKLAGCWHAGTWDPHDFLSQKGMRHWGAPLEESISCALDLNLFATQFSRELFIEGVQVSSHGVTSDLAVTGFPLYAKEWQEHSQPWCTRPMRVVFPHRLAPEKSPEQFDTIRRRYREKYIHALDLPDIEWVRTKDVCKTKQEYYKLLGNSRVAVSTAMQETWGIAMLEAASLGCWPVVPARLSYPEIYGRACNNGTIEEAVDAIYAKITAPVPYSYDEYPWETAINRVSALLEAL